MAMPSRIGMSVPTISESPMPASGPMRPARMPLMVSSSIASPLARASSRPTVTPTIMAPICGSVLKKAEYVVSARC